MNPLHVFFGFCAIGLMYVLAEPVATGLMYRTMWNRHQHVRSTGARMRLADEDAQAASSIVCGLAAVLLAIGWTIIVFRVGG